MTSVILELEWFVFTNNICPFSNKIFVSMLTIVLLYWLVFSRIHICISTTPGVANVTVTLKPVFTSVGMIIIENNISLSIGS
jgi:Cu/Ag efflux pump CusA